MSRKDFKKTSSLYTGAISSAPNRARSSLHKNVSCDSGPDICKHDQIRGVDEDRDERDGMRWMYE